MIQRGLSMDAALQTQIAFHLAGRIPSGTTVGSLPPRARPALLSRLRDLSALRYDFPVVLQREGGGRAYVHCLSGIVDDVVRRLAADEEAGRVTAHMLRLEREIRALLAAGARGTLRELWREATDRLVGHEDDTAARDTFARASAALDLDGDVVDCDRMMPGLLARSAWRVVQEQKTRALGEDLRRLVIGLSRILAADAARSTEGRSAERLRDSIGTGHGSVFDFDELSRVLRSAATQDGLPMARRRRIEALLTTLRSQRFVPVRVDDNGIDSAARAFSFAFSRCSDALAAYRERLPQERTLVRAMAAAELEVAGEYRESVHDALFAASDDDDLGRDTFSRFPAYLVCLSADRMPADETEFLLELLSSGLPVKVLVQTDDLLEELPIARDGHFALGMRARQLANMAIGLTDVYVLQSSASHLFRYRERILRGMEFDGSALFSIYSGATAGAELPPYLAAAAAMESRAFPAYTYDPSAGPSWAARFDLGENSHVGCDWPVQEFTYENERHERVRENLGFTFVDFIAGDPRHGRHFSPVARSEWNESMIPVDACLAANGCAAGEAVPTVTMVDGANNLFRAVADDRVVRSALRCRELWHSLQELGGIHNSHAERVLALDAEVHARQADTRRADPVPAGAPGGAGGAGHDVEVAGAPIAVADVGVGAGADTEAAETPTRDPDEAYIETSRCTTCNECTGINDRMFAYNENKQAYVADLDAGTYAQLVEAAESCQVAIIHPGKPRNPGEPGLAALLARAESFR